MAADTYTFYEYEPADRPIGFDGEQFSLLYRDAWSARMFNLRKFPADADYIYKQMKGWHDSISGREYDLQAPGLSAARRKEIGEYNASDRRKMLLFAQAADMLLAHELPGLLSGEREFKPAPGLNNEVPRFGE